MGQMSREDMRLRDEAIAAGRITRVKASRPKEHKPAVRPDRVYSVPQRSHIVRAPLSRRSMGIQRALEWAFADELAQLDFGDEAGAHEFDRQSVDGVWLLMQRGILGCKVDGGGSNAPAADAQIIAAIVSRLPEGCGGKEMAIMIADHARARSEPDWGRDARMRCVPSEWIWDDMRGCWMASERKVGEHSYWDKHWNKKVVDINACPVQFTGTAQQIARERKAYLGWYGALLHLQSELSAISLDFELTATMPPLAPWRISA